MISKDEKGVMSKIHIHPRRSNLAPGRVRSRSNESTLNTELKRLKQAHNAKQD